MARTPQDVTDTELLILQALWDAGEATIRQITDRLYPPADDGPDAARLRAARHATVQKLLERLEDKGCVRRNREPAAHTFAAAVGRDDLIGRRLQAVAEQLCGGSLTPLLTHLVRAQRLTAEQREELRALIDPDDPDRGRGRRR
jgi:predicted transcriptional regulator